MSDDPRRPFPLPHGRASAGDAVTAEPALSPIMYADPASESGAGEVDLQIRHVAFLSVVELIMRSHVRIERLVTVSDYERHKAGIEAKPSPPAAMPSDNLKPVEQWALLALRNNDAAQAIIAKLKHSTVTAPAMRDYHALIGHGLAVFTSRNAYKLTPRGMAKSSQLIWRLSQELGIPLKPERETRLRGSYRIDVMGDRYFL